MALTREVLEKIAPRPSSLAKAKIWDGYVAALVSAEGGALFAQFGVITSLRMAHWIAQTAHESGNYTIVYESGAYSAKRIMQIFGVGHHSAAVTQAEANRLAGNGYALFERVYGLGNPRKARELGNTKPGDGWTYRGTGLIQTTGRGACEAFAAKIGCAPDQLNIPINSLHAALLEWDEKNCNAAADHDDIVAVTKKINGGRNGLAERRVYLAKAKRVLAGVDFGDAPAPMPVPKPANAPVEIGDEGGSVKELQELLVRAGYVVPVDGIMGPRTESATAGFQVNHGLPGTGIADSETWKALRETVPVERKVDDKKLAQNSRIWQLADRIFFWAKWTGRTIFASLAALFGVGQGDPATGLDVVEQTTGTFDRVNGILSRFHWPEGLRDPKALFLIAAVLAALLAWGIARIAKSIKDARKDDAVSGANLSV